MSSCGRQTKERNCGRRRTTGEPLRAKVNSVSRGTSSFLPKPRLASYLRLRKEEVGTPRHKRVNDSSPFPGNRSHDTSAEGCSKGKVLGGREESGR
jgi:hypothetical protein